MRIHFFSGSFNGKNPIVAGLGLSIGRRVRWKHDAQVRGAVVAIGLIVFGLRIGIGRFEQ